MKKQADILIARVDDLTAERLSPKTEIQQVRNAILRFVSYNINGRVKARLCCC